MMFPDTTSMEIEDILSKKYYKEQLNMTSILRKVANRDLGMQLTDAEIRSSLLTVGGFLLDMRKLRDRIVLPGNGEEINSLTEQVLSAYISQKPIPIFTPFCPDWSRDASGKYDFKSLGGDVSFIAKKFFAEAPSLLAIFQKHKIPYTGTLIFANWGLETEIDTEDTYGRKLTQDDVQMCFASTHERTDEALLELQQGEQGSIFAPYNVIPMTEFFTQQQIDPDTAYKKVHTFFETNGKGKKFVDDLGTESFKVNKKRLGYSEEVNRVKTLQNLAEYATFGQALGEEGIIIACESATATRAYNMPRKNKLPVFYLKGSQALDRGVNIL